MWDPSLSVDDAFEFFASEQALKDADLSVDELQAGVVGGNGDGGIDGVFTFLDQTLLAEDSSIYGEEFDADSIRPGVSLNLHLIQSKITPSFDEVTVTKVSETVKAFFDLDKEDIELRKLYSQEVIDRFALFRDALRIVGFSHPSVCVTFHYATRGESGGINSRVRDRAEILESQFGSITTGATGKVNFLGATELYRLSDKTPKETLQILCKETATSENSYVALVSLKEFFRFITDENGSLNSQIFEGMCEPFKERLG